MAPSRFAQEFFVNFLLLTVLFRVVKERNKLKMTKMPTKTMPMTPKL